MAQNTAISPNSNVLGGERPPTLVVDFWASQEGALVLFLPVTPSAEGWCRAHLGRAWLGAWWLEAGDADLAIRRVLDADFVVRLNNQILVREW